MHRNFFYLIFSGEEIVSDSYKMVDVYEGTAFEIKSRLMAKGEDNIDIGCGNVPVRATYPERHVSIYQKLCLLPPQIVWQPYNQHF